MISLWLNVALLSSGGAVPGSADSQSADLPDVLVAETRNPIDRRDSLRTSAENSASGHWAAGHVRVDDDWLDYDQAVSARAADQVTGEYVKRRRASDQSARDHLALAAWCRRQRLPDRERAHLLAALAQDSSVAAKVSQRRLGFTRTNGEWQSPEQHRRRERMASTIEQSLRVWGSRVERWRRQLEAGGPRSRIAKDELLAVRDPSAVAAIDFLLGRSSRDSARAAVDALSQIDCFESSLTLAKYACFHDVRSVRDAASAALRNRRIEDFVPALISVMVTEFDVQPFHTGIIPLHLREQLIYRDFVAGLVLKRESFNHIQVATSAVRFHLINQYVRLQNGAGLSNSVFEVHGVSEKTIRYKARKSLYGTLREVETLDAEAADLNQRVGAALASATGTKPSADPRHWWSWWYRTMDIEPEDKQVVEVAETRVDDEPIRVMTVVRCSCFAAGTPVWTESGLQPIETIEAGDMVLSKDVETGELAWRPVVRTTVRRQRQLVRINTSADTVDSTPVHRFWRSGHGWTIARDVEADHLIHGVTGSIRVNSVSSGPTEDVYNLVVDGFHTYFVGNDGLLVQDLIVPDPTNMAVPGLTRWELARRLSAATAEDSPEEQTTGG